MEERNKKRPIGYNEKGAIYFETDMDTSKARDYLQSRNIKPDQNVMLRYWDGTSRLYPLYKIMTEFANQQTKSIKEENKQLREFFQSMINNYLTLPQPPKE